MESLAPVLVSKCKASVVQLVQEKLCGPMTLAKGWPVSFRDPHSVIKSRPVTAQLLA